MTTALVFSAGGMWAAWEAGAWRALRERVQPDIIVGASAGAWNGLAVAGGASPDDLAGAWLDPSMANVLGHRPQGLYEKAREICDRFPTRTPFALTMVEVPSLRLQIVRERDITWRHLAASGSIPCVFPPVEIDGRRFVDGGFRGGLPLWAAEQVGATRAIALNVLNTPLFRMLRRTMWARNASAALHVVCIEPSERLGSLRDALVWNAKNIERWMALGERDARRAMTSGRI
jgi:NTE family protein